MKRKLTNAPVHLLILAHDTFVSVYDNNNKKSITYNDENNVGNKDDIETQYCNTEKGTCKKERGKRCLKITTNILCNIIKLPTIFNLKLRGCNGLYVLYSSYKISYYMNTNAYRRNYFVLLVFIFSTYIYYQI